jgi:hypothetical protein
MGNPQPWQEAAGQGGGRMSAKIQPEWVERRANIDPETGARQKRFLIIGVKAAQIAAAFSKLMPNCHIEAAARADHAVLAMASGHFDATLVDCRDDERFHRLAVVAARQFKQGRVALLASDHFLPDEKAVLENLDIFGSSDDSARLLASLQLKAKASAPKQSDPENDGFESALRAELELLRNRAGQSQPAPGTETSTAAEHAAPASEPEELPAFVSSLSLQPERIENAAQSSDFEAPGFLADLTSELEGALFFETTPHSLADGGPESETEADAKPALSGILDLFGNPFTVPEEIELTQDIAPIAEKADHSDGPDLFAYVAAAPAEAQPSQTAPALESMGNLDLFGLLIDDPDVDEPNGPEPESEALQHGFAASHPDLFEDCTSAPKTAEPSDAAPAAPDGLDFFAAIRSELHAIQRSQAGPASLPAMNADAFRPSARAPSAKLPGIAEYAPHVSLPTIEDVAEPVTKKSLLRSTSWLAHLLPRLTPLYSLVYKNLALVILGALFTAFVAFGVMIVFFLTSNKWSAPITLSRGHELVVKVERELSDLNVRKNQISEQIEDAKKNLLSSQDDLGRARQLAGMIEGTISAEIKNRSEMRAEIETHTGALRNVAAQYGNDTLNPQFKGNLEREFDRRLINRNIFEAGKLAQLEAAHRTALIRNEIAANQVEISRLNSTLAALYALSGHVEGTSAPIAGVGGADLVPLLNQVIEVRKGASEAASELKAAESRSALLSDSLETIKASVAQIESTPLARAINENITVLFVPYENAGQYEKGSSLYSCAIGIFFCSEAGKVGNLIEGETVATHPFFNKPLRGSFVEAELTHQDAARKEILHVKRRPLFF